MMGAKGMRGWVIAGLWGAITGLNLVLLPGRYATGVEVERLSLTAMPLIVRASGNLEAKDSHTLKAQFEGPLVSKQFHEGQKVERGQVLAVIGRERIRLDHQEKVNELKNARTDQVRARRDLKIQRELFRKEAVAYSTVEDAERALVKAGQTARNAEEAHRQAEIQWNSSNVLSPLSGTIVKDWIGDDKFITSGKEIVTVADVSAYTVKAQVDELDIKRVHEGQPAEVSLQSFDREALPAVVLAVGSQPEGTGLPDVPVVLALIDTHGLALRPKLTAQARINTGTTEPVLSVPLTAVANADGEPRVWVLGVFNKIHPVHVTLGRTNPERVEVLKGLGLGDRVVVTAEPEFADGMKVIVNVAGDAQSKTPANNKALRKHASSR